MRIEIQVIDKEVSRMTFKKKNAFISFFSPLFICEFILESKKDILFLIDGSANLLGNFPAVRDFVHKVISDLNVGSDATRVAVAQFSDNIQVEFDFSELPSKHDMLLKVKRMKLKTGKQLNIGVALEEAIRRLFVKEAGSRIEEGVPQFLVLLAAGRSSDDVEQPSDALKQAGVVTFAIKAKNADPVELERIVYAPQFILNVDSLARISELQPNIVNLLKTIQLQPTGTGTQGFCGFQEAEKHHLHAPFSLVTGAIWPGDV